MMGKHSRMQFAQGDSIEFRNVVTNKIRTGVVLSSADSLAIFPDSLIVGIRGKMQHNVTAQTLSVCSWAITDRGPVPDADGEVRAMLTALDERLFPSVMYDHEKLAVDIAARSASGRAIKTRGGQVRIWRKRAMDHPQGQSERFLCMSDVDSDGMVMGFRYGALKPNFYDPGLHCWDRTSGRRIVVEANAIITIPATQLAGFCQPVSRLTLVKAYLTWTGVVAKGMSTCPPEDETGGQRPEHPPVDLHHAARVPAFV